VLRHRHQHPRPGSGAGAAGADEDRRGAAILLEAILHDPHQDRLEPGFVAAYGWQASRREQLDGDFRLSDPTQGALRDPPHHLAGIEARGLEDRIGRAAEDHPELFGPPAQAREGAQALLDEASVAGIAAAPGLVQEHLQGVGELLDRVLDLPVQREQALDALHLLLEQDHHSHPCILGDDRRGHSGEADAALAQPEANALPVLADLGHRVEDRLAAASAEELGQAAAAGRLGADAEPRLEGGVHVDRASLGVADDHRRVQEAEQRSFRAGHELTSTMPASSSLWTTRTASKGSIPESARISFTLVWPSIIESTKPAFAGRLNRIISFGVILTFSTVEASRNRSR
jgi:hypothetical protein